MLDNRLVAISHEIGRLKALTELWVRSDVLAARHFFSPFRQLDRNQVSALPREIGELRALQWLSVGSFYVFDLGQNSPPSPQVSYNALTSVPAELGLLLSLKKLWVRRRLSLGARRILTQPQLDRNRLSWLPTALDRLPASTEIYVTCAISCEILLINPLSSTATHSRSTSAPQTPKFPPTRAPSCLRSFPPRLRSP